MRDELALEEANISRILIKLENNEAALAEFRGIREQDMDLIDKAVPQELDLPNILVLTQSLSSSAGLIIEDISVEVQEEKDSLLVYGLQAQPGAITPGVIKDPRQENIRTAVISLDVGGGYQSFKAFLGVLEKSLRISDVQSIAFFVKEEKEGFQEIRFSLVINTYFLKNGNSN